MSITGLSRRQLSYWRKTGLLVPTCRTSGGHARYSFLDLLALKTAKRLIDAGVSVQRLRKSLTALLAFLPGCRVPLSELSLVVTGDVILVLHGESAFEALTGQEWILPVASLERQVAQLQPQPQQGSLFAEAEFAEPADRDRGVA